MILKPKKVKDMKVLVVLLMVVGLSLAGRGGGGGGGGRKKTWYGPVTSETECSASSRSPSLAFKTEDIAASLCRDVNLIL